MILALKTADHTTQVQLYPPKPGAKPVAEFEWESGRDLSDQLLARLVEFLGTRPVAEQTLTGIVIFSGPGSFTSLRIGHTVANALADTLNIPVAGATGEHWVSTAMTALSATPQGQPTLPHYGAEAHITRRKT